MSELMRYTHKPTGEMLLEFSDGRVVDLSKKIRLTKSNASTSGKGFACEGLLNSSIDATSTNGEAMHFRLSFFGGVKADWVPGFGDTIESAE